MKREVALAVVVGALAGLAGAWSARHAAPAAPVATPTKVALEPPAAQVFAEDAPRRAAGRANALSPLLRVQVKPPSSVAVRLSRWSLRAGKGSDGEWLTLPDARTDASGRVEIELPAGTYWVGARLASAQLEVETVTDVELELQPGVPFAGRVLEDGTGRPVAGAVVVASPTADAAPETEKLTTQSDGLGRFAFAEVPGGELQLSASAPGWVTATQNALAPGSADLLLDKSCRVDGVVVDGEGASVGGTREGDAATIAGAGGRFWLELDCKGGELIARDLGGRIGTARIAAGQRTVTVRLQPGVSFTGVVRSSSGELLAGAEVAAMTSDDEPRARTVTDGVGAFTLGPLVDDSYIVRARKGRGAAAAIYGVQPGLQRLELVLEPGAALEGDVLGADDPIDVEVVWAAMRHERPAKTRTLGGHFRFDDLPVGSAVVKASAGDRSKDESIFLSAGRTTPVRLELSPHGRIVGRVSGPGAAGAHVTAWGEKNAGWRSTTAAADGRFELDLPAGDYHLGASSKGSFTQQRFHDTVKVVAGQPSPVELTLQAGDAGDGWGAMASVARGEIGASFENVSGAVQVSWLVADSPMSSAGLQVGDRLTAIDGEPVSTALDAFARTRGTPGATVAITYVRNGAEHTVAVARAQ